MILMYKNKQGVRSILEAKTIRYSVEELSELNGYAKGSYAITITAVIDNLLKEEVIHILVKSFEDVEEFDKFILHGVKENFIDLQNLTKFKGE